MSGLLPVWFLSLDDSKSEAYRHCASEADPTEERTQVGWTLRLWSHSSIVATTVVTNKLSWGLLLPLADPWSQSVERVFNMLQPSAKSFMHYSCRSHPFIILHTYGLYGTLNNMTVHTMHTCKCTYSGTPLHGHPWNEDISFNQATMHGPSYIEKCIKQPLKWGHLL